VVVAADGLAGRSLRELPGFAPAVSATARVGTSTIRPAAEGAAYAAGRIYMGVGPGGYAGLVRLEDGRLNIAAALTVARVQAEGGSAGAVGTILADAGLPPLVGLAAGRWQGVPALTRRRRKLSAVGVFVVGDAAGYVEPFTGEGMAWALASAAAVVPLALEALRSGWSPKLSRCWAARHRALLAARQRRCRVVAWLLRRPGLVGLGVGLLAWRPRLAWPYVQSLNRPLGG
jgi:flavin-dependent dehydrogenase